MILTALFALITSAPNEELLKPPPYPRFPLQAGDKAIIIPNILDSIVYNDGKPLSTVSISKNNRIIVILAMKRQYDLTGPLYRLANNDEAADKAESMSEYISEKYDESSEKHETLKVPINKIVRYLGDMGETVSDKDLWRVSKFDGLSAKDKTSYYIESFSLDNYIPGVGESGYVKPNSIGAYQTNELTAFMEAKYIGDAGKARNYIAKKRIVKNTKLSPISVLDVKNTNIRVKILGGNLKGKILWFSYRSISK